MFARYTQLAILGLLFFTANSFLKAQDTLYVNLAATGANDGSSWQNAFVDLQSALGQAVTGDEVWVAQGTYYPDTMGGNRASTFLIDENIKLLGGFSGFGGTTGNTADPDQFITRLSGDLAQDDIPFDLATNRSDNVLTVVTVELGIDESTTIDGFYIENGHADGDFTAFQNERGGGLFSYGSPLISRCVFDSNFAEEGGGGLYFHTGGAEGAHVVDCFFVGNGAEDGGGAMCYIQGDVGVTFESCDFDGNRAEDGGALRVYNSNALLIDCQFQFNRAERGGALDVRSIWDDNETQVLNTFFFENLARHGGAIQFQTQSGLGSHDNFLTVDGCEFFGNQATLEDPEANGGRQGGAIRANIERTTNGCGVRIRNSDFSMNMSERDGGAIAANLRGETMTFLLENTFLQDNSARNAGGVAILAGDIATGTATINGCDIIGNMAEENAGVIRFLADRTSQLEYVVEENVFLLNTAQNVGGVLYIDSRDTSEMDINVSGNWFEGNSADLGGTVALEANGSTFYARFSQNIFLGNFANSTTGVAALSSSSLDATLDIDNCFFNFNDGGGSVILADDFPQMNLINNTVADNTSSAVFCQNGSGIYFQNNIFSNLDFEFAKDNSVGEFESGGGNLISDETMEFILGPLDQSETNPLFEVDFQLSEDSPAVDMGVLPDDAPEFDAAGNPRVVNCIDAGAFESIYEVGSSCLTDTREVNNLDLGLTLSPNPADDFLSVKWSTYLDEATLELLNVNGQVLRNENVNYSGNIEWDVTNLTSGVYFIRMTVSEGSDVKRVVVQ